MATEFLYATSHITGSLTNPDNALGNTPTTWAGVVNANTSADSRYAIGDPVDPLTTASTQTIRVVARKGSNSGTPTVALHLWENGAAIKTLVAATNITSTTGQTLTGTFDPSEITNRADVEIRVVVSGVGGSGSVRNSAQISHIEWEAQTTAPSTDRKARITWVELESPNGARLARITWVEAEAPNAPRLARVTWAEAETPTPPRLARSLWAEMEAPTAPRLMRALWAELEAPVVPDSDRLSRVTWVEVEAPLAPRLGRILWVEMEAPSAPRLARIVWAEMAVAAAGGLPGVGAYAALGGASALRARLLLEGLGDSTEVPESLRRLLGSPALDPQGALRWAGGALGGLPGLLREVGGFEDLFELEAALRRFAEVYIPPE